MKNKEKYLTNFSEAKRKKAIQKYNIIKPFTLGEQSLASISKSKGIALSTLYRWNKSYKQQGLKGLIYATRTDKGTRKIEPRIIDEIDNLSKDETHHILEYKWQDLGFDLKLEDFTDYEAITTIIKIKKGILG